MANSVIPVELVQQYAYSSYTCPITSGATIRIFRIGRLRYFSIAGHCGGEILLDSVDHPSENTYIFPTMNGYGSTWSYGDIEINYTSHKLTFRDSSGATLSGTYVRCSGCYPSKSL